MSQTAMAKQPNLLQRELTFFVSRLQPAIDYKKIVFVAGTGRSGTTWLAEMLNSNNDFRIFFEPFYNQKVEQFKHLSYRPYFRKGHQDKTLTNDIKKILKGKGLNRWILSRDRNPFAKKLIIKDIRANLLLSYLKENIPGIRLVLLIRHPIDVALSREKLGWPVDLGVFFNQSLLIDDFLCPFEKIIKSAKDNFEKNILLWCVENYVPLKQFKPDDLHVVFYESITSNPDEEFRRIFEYIDEPLNDKLFTVMDRRSSTDWNKAGPEDPATERGYTADQVKKYRKYAEAFGLSALYGPDENPDHKAADQLLRTSSL
jgi:hypothetical protein